MEFIIIQMQIVSSGLDPKLHDPRRSDHITVAINHNQSIKMITETKPPPLDSSLHFRCFLLVALCARLLSQDRLCKRATSSSCIVRLCTLFDSFIYKGGAKACFLDSSLQNYYLLASKGAQTHTKSAIMMELMMRNQKTARE